MSSKIILWYRITSLVTKQFLVSPGLGQAELFHVAAVRPFAERWPPTPPIASAHAAMDASQLAAFETFGFLHLPSQYSADEMAAVRREADATLGAIEQEAQTAAGRAEGGLTSHWGRQAQKFVEESALLTRWLVEDDRVFSLVAAILGEEDFVWTTSNHIEASPAGPEFPGRDGQPMREHGWHCDIAGVAEAAIKRVKVMFYLTPTTREKGALRVLPGTHTAAAQANAGLRSLMGSHGMNTTLDEQWAASTFGIPGDELPSHAIEATPGDIVVWQLGLFHAVYNHAPDRRLLQLNFSSRPKNTEQWVSLWRNMSSGFRPHPKLLAHTNPKIRALCVAPSTEEAAKLAAHYAEVEKSWPFPDVDINQCHTSATWRERHGRVHWREAHL